MSLDADVDVPGSKHSGNAMALQQLWLQAHNALSTVRIVNS